MHLHILGVFLYWLLLSLGLTILLRAPSAAAHVMSSIVTLELILVGNEILNYDTDAAKLR